MRRSSAWMFITELSWRAWARLGGLAVVIVWTSALGWSLVALSLPSKAATPQESLVNPDLKSQVYYDTGKLDSIDKRVTVTEALLASDREKFAAIQASLQAEDSRLMALETHYDKISEALWVIALGVVSLVIHTFWDRLTRKRV
jgi:hypothetical protein